MPYEIIMNAENCDGHAVVKVGETTPVEGGCHLTHQEAVDHVTALNIATADEERAETYKANAGMKAEARKGLQWRTEFNRGGTAVGVARARDIVNDANFPLQTVKRMYSYFSRHEVDKEAQGFRQGEDGFPSAGRIAWALWGGDAGFSWSQRIIASLEEQRNSQADSTIIVDIDDTLLRNGTEPIQSVIDYVNADFEEYNIVIITGRPEAARDETVAALADAGVQYDRLIMKADDSVPTPEYKKAEAEKLLSEGEVDKAIDNDQSNLDAYASLGIETVLPSELSEDDDTMEMESAKRYSDGMTGTVNWVATAIDEKRSIAYSNLEVRSENEGRTIVGYAAVWDSPSEYMGFTEFVKRGAFSKTLNDGADVRLLIDHEGVPLARSKSGTLSLVEDDRGLRVEAELDPMNPDAARVMSAMKRGDLSQMSFAFRTVKDNWNTDRSVRELREVQLFDVSVVTFPAYEQTVAELRKRIEPVTIAPVSTLSLRKNQVALQKLRSR